MSFFFFLLYTANKFIILYLCTFNHVLPIRIIIMNFTTIRQARCMQVENGQSIDDRLEPRPGAAGGLELE